MCVTHVSVPPLQAKYAYDLNLLESTYLLAECHQSMFNLEVLLGSLKKMHESFCILSMKVSVPRIIKNISKKFYHKVKISIFNLGFDFLCRKSLFLLFSELNEVTKGK